MSLLFLYLSLYFTYQSRCFYFVRLVGFCLNFIQCNNDDDDDDEYDVMTGKSAGKQKKTNFIVC